MSTLSYPGRVDASLEPRLNRGLWLVKWLLVLPHYLVLGMNRWVIRVAAYAGLMSDEYPPFRLDMGPEDPGSPGLAMSGPATAVQAPQDPPPAPGAPPGPGSSAPWSTGRVVAMALGCVVLLVSGGLVTGGVTLAVAQATVRDDAGFFMSAEQEFQTTTYAIVSDGFETRISDEAQFVPDKLLGDTKLTVTPGADESVFVGIGPTAEVDAYLADVAHTTVVGFATTAEAGGEPVYRDVPGGAPATDPDEAAVTWAAQTQGTGTQDVVWALEEGDWTVVVMNADGSAEMTVDVAAGAEFPAVGWAIAILLSLGGTLLILAALLIIGALRAGRTEGSRPVSPS